MGLPMMIVITKKRKKKTRGIKIMTQFQGGYSFERMVQVQAAQEKMQQKNIQTQVTRYAHFNRINRQKTKGVFTIFKRYKLQDI